MVAIFPSGSLWRATSIRGGIQVSDYRHSLFLLSIKMFFPWRGREPPLGLSDDRQTGLRGSDPRLIICPAFTRIRISSGSFLEMNCFSFRWRVNFLLVDDLQKAPLRRVRP